MINTLSFWVLIGIISTVVAIWLFLVIYRRIRYEIFVVSGFVFLILSLSFNLEFAFQYLVALNQEIIYIYVSLALAILALGFILLGIISSNRRWVSRRGTSNLNRFRNLFFFAYVRHPITFGLMIITIVLMLQIHTIFSNVFASLALIFFLISSYEKDNFFEKIYGYPYRLYTNQVPRFNIVLGFIKSLITKQKNEQSEKGQYVTYD